MLDILSVVTYHPHTFLKSYINMCLLQTCIMCMALQGGLTVCSQHVVSEFGLTFFSGVVCFGSRRAMGAWASRHHCCLVPDHSHLGKQRRFQTQSTQPQSCFLWLLPCQNSAWHYRIVACTSNSSQRQTRTVLGLGTPLQVCITGMTWSADLP